MATVLTYTLSSGNATITGYTGDAPGTLIIPDTIDGYPVVAIGDNAFNSVTSITSLTIGANVISIGNNTFDSCWTIGGALVIPNNVEIIGSYAFKDCISLTSLSIGTGMTAINEGSFYDCSALNGDFIIPNNITSIGDSAFRFCFGYTGDLRIPDSVIAIGALAFDNCTGFDGDLILGSGVATIGDYAFNTCYLLNSMIFMGDVPTIGVGIFDNTYYPGIPKIGYYHQPYVYPNPFAGIPMVELDSSSSSSSNSSSSSSGNRIVMIPDETYTISLENYENKFEYIGDINTTANIIIGALPFEYKIANISNQLVWGYDSLSPYTFTYVGETIDVVNKESVYKVTYDGHGSLLFSIDFSYSIPSDQVYVAMACRDYGQGRIFIHTDRIGGYKTGHGDNSKDFWRNILEWSSKKTSEDIIKLALIINTQPSASDKIKSMKPIEVDKISVFDLASEDLSKYDCIYMVGLPNSVSSLVTNKIKDFVNNGGGLVLEYPNIGDDYINVLSDIEDLYCYSSERYVKSDAYWTIDGGNSQVFNDNAKISFMSTFRAIDFSSRWTLLMTNIPNYVTTTTTTSAISVLTFDKSSSADFSISYSSSMKNGIISIEFDV